MMEHGDVCKWLLLLLFFTITWPIGILLNTISMSLLLLEGDFLAFLVILLLVLVWFVIVIIVWTINNEVVYASTLMTSYFFLPFGWWSPSSCTVTLLLYEFAKPAHKESHPSSSTLELELWSSSSLHSSFSCSCPWMMWWLWMSRSSSSWSPTGTTTRAPYIAWSELVTFTNGRPTKMQSPRLIRAPTAATPS